MPEKCYVGEELVLFAAAVNWKAYWSNKVKKYIKGSVAEIGAGIGINTAFLLNTEAREWTFVEPDPEMASALREENCFSRSNMPHTIYCDTLSGLKGKVFDTIIYIDVLEHIERDDEEVATAAEALEDHGILIVLSPAYQFLFSPFDAAIGHYRRYNKTSLGKLTPKSLQLIDLFYLDSAGLLLSLANKVMLRRSMPTARDIWIWDKVVIPLSRVIDYFMFYLLGRTIVAIWQKQPRESHHA